MTQFANKKNTGKNVTLSGMWQSKKNKDVFTGQVDILELKEALKALYAGSPTRRAFKDGEKVTVCFSAIPPEYRKANGPSHKVVVLGPNDAEEKKPAPVEDDLNF